MREKKLVIGLIFGAFLLCGSSSVDDTMKEIMDNLKWNNFWTGYQSGMMTAYRIDGNHDEAGCDKAAKQRGFYWNHKTQMYEPMQWKRK